ncbi:DNA segregation ATPase FtsK/SpoIIIE, S-DNA-T family [Actinoplanes philippinensis]|uniref:DNA segregation ATPase FtsK/SpoIIIE, S-DNA-T family n=1 Tax=Actinoplanes philippinensis TaxID=35752 RepID=A0A1I2HL96_9ACTN|nr:type VII secretion protein EccCb [Actinoplanes philippinensis]SFF30452.1 DNA segregation ATPase FtsK/SpoIIIE, S-DNA-T family [Actinoplanes philippinensis]
MLLESRDHLRFLAQQRTALLWRHPEPDTLASVAASPRMWERRPGDDDFAEVRIAVDSHRLPAGLVLPEAAPAATGPLPGLPVAVRLREFRRLLLRGDREPVTGLARAVLAQLATLHSPDELRLAVVAAPERRAGWDWVLWLPHTRADPTGGRLVFDSMTDLDQALAAEATPVVVVLDGAARPAEIPQTMTVVELSGPPTEDQNPRWYEDARSLLRLDVAPSSLTVDTGLWITSLGRPDALTTMQAERTAQEIALNHLSDPSAATAGPSATSGPSVPAALEEPPVAPYEDLSPDREPLPPIPEDPSLVVDPSPSVPPVVEPSPSVPPVAESSSPLLVAEPPPLRNELTDLLSLGDLADLDPTTVRRGRDGLRLPLGLAPDGGVVELDLDTMGPHGLVVGATGSGKSELLRTVVTALAVINRSEDFTFVLVDHRGGAAFTTFEKLPHISAIMGHTDEPAAVARLHDALAGELARRERALDDGITLPRLLVICDEFTELLERSPDLADLFTEIGRTGAALGVHLLLAAQRLEEGRLRGLDGHLSYRIALRTFSATESRIALGVPDAYDLPRRPGTGLLKAGDGPLVAFRAAYVSGPYVPDAEPDAHVSGAYVPGASPGAAAFDAGADAYVPGGRPGDDRRSVAEVIVDRLAGHGRPAHQVWLPPLTDPASLGDLLGDLHVVEGRGLVAESWPGAGRLTVPLGVVDRPFEQRRDTFVLEIGNLAVAGGPQSGKSTLLRTVISALALTHSPREVQFFCLDFGGGGLHRLDGLPHLAGVAARTEGDTVRRIVAEVAQLIEDRDARRIESIAAYRRSRASGEVTDDPFGDVFLVIDGWATLRRDFEELEQAVIEIALRGPGLGVHVVVSAGRWADVRPAMQPLFGARLELHLGEPGDSVIDRRAAADVPAGAPGRGLTPDRLHFLTALPRIDGSTDVSDLAEGVTDLAGQVKAAWPDDPAPRVRLLPALIPAADLAGAPGLPIGLNEANLAPVSLDPAADRHLVIFGDGACGKTNLLRLIARGVVATHSLAEARLVLVDYRRGLRGAIDGEHLLVHATTSQHLADNIESIHAAMSRRLPGPDVTAEQLRNRSWWSGPDLYILVDDYDLVSAGGHNPLARLAELLPYAHDIGLHLIIARRSGGAGRAMYEPLLHRLRELAVPALIMSGDREEGRLFGSVRPSPQPPGRGFLVRRSDDVTLVQTAWSDPDTPA